jgi:hypothetical protein
MVIYLRQRVLQQKSSPHLQKYILLQQKGHNMFKNVMLQFFLVKQQSCCCRLVYNKITNGYNKTPCVGIISG